MLPIKSVEMPKAVETSASTVSDVAPLLFSKKLTEIVAHIETRATIPRSRGKVDHADVSRQQFSSSSGGIPSTYYSSFAVIGPVEADPEFELIVDANITVIEIDAEVAKMHSFARTLYSRRFPELELLIPDPRDYLRAVEEIGNELHCLGYPWKERRLSRFLSPATVAEVLLSASRTEGEPLGLQEIAIVIEACFIANELVDIKSSIMSFIEGRLNLIAPNLMSLTGASLAVRLIAAAGGCSKISTMSRGKIELLGAPVGVSDTDTPPCGFIFQSRLVQEHTSDLRIEAAKQLAYECSLATKADRAFRHSLNSRHHDPMRLRSGKELAKATESKPVKRPRGSVNAEGPCERQLLPQRTGGERYFPLAKKARTSF